MGRIVLAAASAAGVLAALSCDNRGAARRRIVQKENVEVVPVDDPSLGRAVGGLEAELATYAGDFSLGQDIPLTLTLRNVSQNDITLLRHRDEVYGYAFFTRFVVRMPYGTSVILGDPPGDCRFFPMRALSFPSSTSLRPGESYTWRTVLNVWRPLGFGIGSSGFPFGWYAIYADYSPVVGRHGSGLWVGTLRSNPIRFRVTRDPVRHDPEAIRWGQVAHGLRCGIATDKVVYQMGEKITGTVVVRNAGGANTPDGRIEISDIPIVRCHGTYERVPLTDRHDALKRPGSLWLEKDEEVKRKFDLSGLLKRYQVKPPVTLTLQGSAATTRKPNAPGAWLNRSVSDETRILIVDAPPRIESMDRRKLEAQLHEVEREIQHYFKQLKQPPRADYQSWAKRGKALRPLLPGLLKLSDMNVVHEALLLARDHFDAPEVVPHIIAVLDGLLKSPKDKEGGTRRLACEVLGAYRDAAAIPVLLRALKDTHVHIDFSPVEPGHALHMEWHAVWRDADQALRDITGANPIEPARSRNPVPAAPYQKAWQAWWRKDVRCGPCRHPRPARRARASRAMSQTPARISLEEIFDRPRRRSSKTIGTSPSFIPASD
ncbi:MAG: hypothetical protein AMS16_07095 [Planctomycetes bacterium DG_58]|nr:MAG: hypothetical protein AMS16_07095 [Planctomycetes bacterium DG_58]